MRPDPLKTRYIFYTIVFLMELRRYWNTPELKSVTGSSQNAQTKTNSASDFQRDSSPIFSTRRKDKMPLRLVGVPFFEKNGELTVIARQKAESLVGDMVTCCYSLKIKSSPTWQPDRIMIYLLAMERCPSGLRSQSWKLVMRQRTVGSNPTLSAINPL